MNAESNDRGIRGGKRAALLAISVLLLSLFARGYAVANGGQFNLVRGQHVEVCEAYLARLNRTRFEEAPFCDRPESDSVPGFSVLDRVPLTPDVVFELWPSIASMLKPYANTSDWTLEAANQELGRSILAWKYDPNVDIQNDGSSQPVIVWRGSRIQWGIENSDFACGLSDRRTPQMAFILNPSLSQVDEAATRKVFWRSKPGTVASGVSQKTYSVELPIGEHMSIFKFKDLYYFDTFYDNDGWGDYQNKRSKDKQLGNTLAVFLNRRGETHEVCELH